MQDWGRYEDPFQYQKDHNIAEFEKLKSYCAEMNIDLILEHTAPLKRPRRGGRWKSGPMNEL